MVLSTLNKKERKGLRVVVVDSLATSSDVDLCPNLTSKAHFKIEIH